ncbi:hypothetical protein CRUP_022652 [Coryphaenoides rupestris]|nr:hypothetical protein CRUP_022652 [Coryphaenoides rupestris]
MPALLNSAGPGTASGRGAVANGAACCGNRMGGVVGESGKKLAGWPHPALWGGRTVKRGGGCDVPRRGVSGVRGGVERSLCSRSGLASLTGDRLERYTAAAGAACTEGFFLALLLRNFCSRRPARPPKEPLSLPGHPGDQHSEGPQHRSCDRSDSEPHYGSPA